MKKILYVAIAIVALSTVGNEEKVNECDIEVTNFIETRKSELLDMTNEIIASDNREEYIWTYDELATRIYEEAYDLNFDIELGHKLSDEVDDRLRGFLYDVEDIKICQHDGQHYIICNDEGRYRSSMYRIINDRNIYRIKEMIEAM